MVQALPEICLATLHLRRRYIIPSLDLIDREELEKWGWDFAPIEEVNQRLYRVGCSQRITNQTLRNWEFQIGTRVKIQGERTDKKAFYTPNEVDQLDDLYRAKHLIGMTLKEYSDRILEQGKTLQEVLYRTQKHG